MKLKEYKMWEECKYWADYVFIALEYSKGEYFLTIDYKSGPYTLEQLHNILSNGRAIKSST